MILLYVIFSLEYTIISTHKIFKILLEGIKLTSVLFRSCHSWVPTWAMHGFYWWHWLLDNHPLLPHHGQRQDLCFHVQVHHCSNHLSLSYSRCSLSTLLQVSLPTLKWKDENIHFIHPLFYYAGINVRVETYRRHLSHDNSYNWSHNTQ